MNKNVKKIVTLCLYGIALSANIAAMDCQKGNLNFNNQINNDKEREVAAILASLKTNEKEYTNTDQSTKKRKIIEITNVLELESNKYNKIDSSLIDTNIDTNKLNKNRNEKEWEIVKTNGKEYIKLDLSNIDTEKKYNNVALNLPEGKKTLVSISCPDCNSIRIGQLGKALWKMGDHRKQRHGIERHTKKTLNKNIPTIETKYTIKFSDIDTPQKYDDVAHNLPEGKGTLAFVSCSEPGCDQTTVERLSMARRSIGLHREKIHNIKYHAKKTVNKNISTIETEYTIEFSDIDTLQKYDAVARNLPEGKGTLAFVSCSEPGCDQTTVERLSMARRSIGLHREKIHNIKYLPCKKNRK